MKKIDRSSSAKAPSSPAPDPEIMRKDPMAEFFGPGTTARIIGDPDDAMPDEVRALLEQTGISRKKFQCSLRVVPIGVDLGEEGSFTLTEFLASWPSGIPTFEYIARKYGPGTYLLCFNWKAPKEEGGSESCRRELPVVISEKYADDFKKIKRERMINDAKTLGTQVTDSLIEKNIEGQVVRSLTGGQEQIDPATAGKNYISSIAEGAKMLGIPFGQPQQKTIEWDKLLPTLVPLVLGFLQHQASMENKRSEEFNKMLILMLGQGKDANTQLIEIMKMTSGSGSNTNLGKEYLEMVKSVVDIKTLTSPQQDTVVDKVFRLVEGVLPNIMAIASTAAQARANRDHPMMKFARNYVTSDPSFKELQSKPAEKIAFVNKMDRFFGTKRTDVILQVAGEGWERPKECPRDPALEEPPQTVNEQPNTTIPVQNTEEETEGGTEEVPGE